MYIYVCMLLYKICGRQFVESVDHQDVQIGSFTKKRRGPPGTTHDLAMCIAERYPSRSPAQLLPLKDIYIYIHHITHRIHGAGIYANMTGVYGCYIDGKC